MTRTEWEELNEILETEEFKQQLEELYECGDLLDVFYLGYEFSLADKKYGIE